MRPSAFFASRFGATCFSLAFTLFLSLCAHAQNPEDEPLIDEDVPAIPAPNVAPPVVPVAPTPVPTDAPAVAPGDPNEVVTLTRGQLDQLLRTQAELQRQIDELKRGATPIVTPTPAPVATSAPPPSGTNRALLLPDISFIGNAVGLYSTDKRAEDRSSFRLSEGELSIQGYVYPGVKADAYLVAAPGEDEAAQLEETYLTFIGVRPGLNIYAGRKFVPFGRTGELHPHSWQYSRQLLPRRNLIAEEALVGDGANFRYTRAFGKLYAQADFGIFSGEGPGEAALDENGSFDPTNPFGDGVPTGTGAGFTRRFYNSRLYFALPRGDNGEIALGGSYARGRSEIDGLGSGNSAVYGLDATYRRYLSGGKRYLARAEYFGYNPGRGLSTRKAGGYYGLLNYRFEPRKDIGLLYERSEFPQAGGHESATSLIYTKQFTERFYTRLHATRGRRPGEGGYYEAFLQFVFGLGPHTHNLE